jgi:transcriptional regulator with XRE-family HTH domain
MLIRKEDPVSDLSSALSRFGSRVKKMRERRDMTQKELSEESGLSQSAISRIESGEHGLTVENLYDLAEGLDCRITSLMKDFFE